METFPEVYRNSYGTLNVFQAVRVFAGHGLDGNGDYAPTATGRLCRWTEGEQPADSFASYGAYQRSLSLHCDDGHPGILHWTPDENTPDLVYYQVSLLCQLSQLPNVCSVFTRRKGPGKNYEFHAVNGCSGEAPFVCPGFKVNSVCARVCSNGQYFTMNFHYL